MALYYISSSSKLTLKTLWPFFGKAFQSTKFERQLFITVQFVF